MIRTLLVALALLAAACTTTDLDDVWSKPDAPVHQAARDDWECRREAYATAPRTVDLYVGGVADAVRVWRDDRLSDAAYADCMRERGYQLKAA